MLKRIMAPLISFLIVASICVTAHSEETIDWDEIINTVNNVNGGTWKAGLNFPRNTSYSYLKKLQGTILENKPDPAHSHPYFLDEIPNSKIPSSFDARKKWPHCKNVINHIRDQGACGSCWAVAAASAFTDQLCVASKLKNEMISSADVLACTIIGGCYGGFLPLAWIHIKHTGAVTGGDYGSKKGCMPYTVQPCEHHEKGKRPQCSSLTASTPSCPWTCPNKGYKSSFDDDKHYANDYFSIQGEINIQKALMATGPVETGFDVYEDFLTYKSGVYKHTTGKMVGGHAVKIIGWGTENHVPYWLVANSWNTDWGDKGFFKIKRGNNECTFESDVYGGLLK